MTTKESLTDRLARHNQLADRLAMLTRQMEVYNAVYTLSQHYYDAEPNGKKADDLLFKLAPEILHNCERIYDLSLPREDSGQ